MKSSIKSLAKNSETLLKAGLVPLVRSSPGVGKTSVIRQMAEALNLKVIDIRLSQCDTTDLDKVA
jgi:MoxR-like ATPase